MEWKRKMAHLFIQHLMLPHVRLTWCRSSLNSHLSVLKFKKQFYMHKTTQFLFYFYSFFIYKESSRPIEKLLFESANAYRH